MPRAALGVISNDEPRSDPGDVGFAEMPMPKIRHQVNGNGYAQNIEQLEIDGPCFYVVIGSQEPKKLGNKLRHAIETVRRSHPERKFTIRQTKLGVEPVTGVWRLPDLTADHNGKTE